MRWHARVHLFMCIRHKTLAPSRNIYEYMEYLWRPFPFLLFFFFHVSLVLISLFSIFLIDHATKIIHCEFSFMKLKALSDRFLFSNVKYVCMPRGRWALYHFRRWRRRCVVYLMGCDVSRARVCVCDVFNGAHTFFRSPVKCLLFKYVFIIYWCKALFWVSNPTAEIAEVLGKCSGHFTYCLPFSSRPHFVLFWSEKKNRVSSMQFFISRSHIHSLTHTLFLSWGTQPYYYDWANEIWTNAFVFEYSLLAIRTRQKFERRRTKKNKIQTRMKSCNLAATLYFLV